MFYQLPPVGNSVCLYAQNDPAVTPLFSSYQTQYYDTGTAALAAAICAAIEVKNSNNAEIILPAYACPDLISAVVYAGAIPVLVDFESERPWLDLSLLASAITENTAAIIAVNLFGISERWPQLRELANQSDIVLIEDSAQYFPASGEAEDWQGDLVVLSFGRGKPVSLLGGGAVLTKKSALFELLPKPQISPPAFGQRVSFGLKARLYNAMISPYFYWLPQAMPFLHLGETRYHVLSAIEGMDQVRVDLLARNIACYQRDTKVAERGENISTMLKLFDRVINLPRVCGINVNRRLLRYPILVEAAGRDRIYRKLKQAGLGASIMYPASLPEIPGLRHVFKKKQRFPRAENFASRIITLPTHAYVGKKEIESMNKVLAGCFGDG